MSTSITSASKDRSKRPGELHLSHWPLRDGGFSAWGALGCATLLSVGVGFLAHQTNAGLLSFAALMTTMWRLWIPVTFQLGPRGITQIVLGRRRQIAWRYVARYEVRRTGVLFFCDATPTPLAVLRSTSIHWGRHREELLAVLSHYLDPDSDDILSHH